MKQFLPSIHPSFFLYVCMVCMYSHRGHSRKTVVVLYCSPPYNSLETESFTEPEAHCCSEADWPGSSQDQYAPILNPCGAVLGLKAHTTMPNFVHGCWDPNLGSHACAANTLSH